MWRAFELSDEFSYIFAEDVTLMMINGKIILSNNNQNLVSNNQ